MDGGKYDLALVVLLMLDSSCVLLDSPLHLLQWDMNEPMATSVIAAV